jgi:hypothetical protein
MQRGPVHSWFSDQLAPLIEMTFPSAFTDDELEGALAAVSTWLLDEVRAPFAFIVNMAHPLGFTAKQRKMMAATEASYAHVDRAFNAGQAVVVPNALARGTVRLVYWFSPPICPVTTVSSRVDALAWIEPVFARSLEQFPDGPLWSKRRPLQPR